METVVLRLRLRPPFGLPDFGGPVPRSVWTIVGATSVPLWAIWPTLASMASSMPAFQVLTLAFAVGWALLTLLDRSKPSGRAVDRDSLAGVLPVLVCAFGLCGTNAFFILATAHIPAAQANLISYMWPIAVVVLGAAAGFFRLRARHAAGLVIGFLGAFVVIGAEDAVLSWQGVALAGASGVSWALFCLFRLWQGPRAGDVLADGCGLSAFLCLGLHLAFETTVWPEPAALLATIGVGIAPLGLANLAWDGGIRHGDGRALAVMAYATPLCGALLLIAFGFAQATWALLIGSSLIVGAGLLSTARVDDATR